MSEREPSRTALGVAAMRAAHMLIDAEPRILDDPVILRLLDPAVIERIRAEPERHLSEGAKRLRTHVLVRSRYAEDRLAEAVRRGIGQAVSLGAGFDTFAYRQPGWARSLHIFEVDQPASQRQKRDRLAAAGIDIPENVRFVPIDFETTTVADGLRAGGFDPARPAFFSWLGVMIYLTQEASDAVFRFAASLPKSSEIVFTFSQPRSAERKGLRAADVAASLGEPWINFVSEDALAARLKGFGFSQVTLLTPDEITRRYIGDRRDGLHTSDRTTIASAVV